MLCFKASPRRRQVVAALGTLGVDSASAGTCMVSAQSAKALIWRDRRRMDAPGAKSDAIPVI
jgi:hypothetical protein